MRHYRDLLAAVIRATSGKAQQSAVASLFSPGPSDLGTNAGNAGLENVEVIAWVAVVA
jgi:hypothetical protein